MKMTPFVKILRLLPVTKRFSYYNVPNVFLSPLTRFLSTPNQTPNELTTSKRVEIIERIQLKHGSKYDFVLEHVKNVTNYLITECEADFESVSEMFCQQPILGDVTQHKWREIVNFLCENGIPISTIIEIATKCPQIITKTKVSQLESCFEVFRQESFIGANNVSIVLQSAPLLFVTDPNYVKRRIAILKTMFTQNDIFNLVTTCPNVLFDDWEDIEAKAQYVVHRIGLDQKQMLQSCLFMHSLRHIEIRHQLMVKTGVFKKPHPKKWIPNPHLSKMVDTTTEKFLKTIGITVEEYEVFEKMFDIQNEYRKDKDEESGSSDDDDDEEEK